MANTTSQSYTFDKTLPIDEIVEESYERIGIINVSGYQLKTAKRSLNLLFSEWSNRGLHYWEVANQGFTLVDGTNVYTSYRSPSDGASNGLTTTLSAGINASVTNIPFSHVVGMAGVLDTSRFEFHLAEALNISAQNVSSTVLGGHGDDMVALLRHTTVSGVSLEDMIKMKKISRQKVNEIVQRIRTCGAEIITYMGTSAYYAPAAAVVQMIECYLRDQKKILPCSAYLKGQYGFKNIYAGVPVVLGANGVEKIIEISLKNEEKKEFLKSIKSIQSVLDIAKKLF